MKKKGVILLLFLVAMMCTGSVLSHFQVKGYKKLKRSAKTFLGIAKKPRLNILFETPETRDIAAFLKTYKIYHSGSPIKLRYVGKANDGGYVIPEIALQEADVILGYGIGSDISFEDFAAAIYGKPSYGFDGTCPPIKGQHELCHFIPLCIVSNASGERKNSSSFEEQLDMLGIRGKKLFIKMDIESNEYETMPDILKHAANITGIVLEIHFCDALEVSRALNLLRMLDKDFFLTHVHGNNSCLAYFVTKNSKGNIPRILELTYIHKRFAQKYEVARNQKHPTKLDMPNVPHLPEATFTILP